MKKMKNITEKQLEEIKEDSSISSIRSKVFDIKMIL
jgi:hypothetical protein